MSEPTELTIALDFTPYLSRRIGYDYDADVETSEQVTFEGLIVEQVARQLFDRAVSNVERDQDRWGYHGLKAKVQDIAEETIREHVNAIVLTQLDEALAPTCGHDPDAPPKTLKDRILELAKEQLDLRAPSTNYNGRSQKGSLLYEAVTQASSREIQKELTVALAEGKEQVKKALRESGAQLLAETIAKQAGS